MSNNHLIDNRQIRVFISSTFQDMQDERDYLMKHTFPGLRKLAASRDVTLTELDLRWGITEEESESGKVVEICLQEIDNCIPFFIGIIGNRYGWVPGTDDVGKEITERFPMVGPYLERHLSVTEMEMQFGVLQREGNMHAYFYIKDETAASDNPEMLERLKQEVRASKYPTSGYSTPEDLASQVEQAFASLLDQLFPEGEISELEKERIGQRSFMNQLCLNYIRDGRNFEALDNWLNDEDSRQLVVTGASGLGKSALIANWLKEKLRDKDRGCNIIYHFTGNGGSESSHEYIKKVLADEINDVYGWTAQENRMRASSDGANEKDGKLKDLFVRVVSEGDRPLLIVLDAINQIVDADNAKLLNWLPVPPKNVKIMFSTLEDDRTMEVFRNRHYPLFELHPLDADQRQQLVDSYLHDVYAKRLSPEQVRRIVSAPQCENPLVLKTLLNELVLFGIHEKLDEKIDYYLSKGSIEDFYQAVIQSYEEEFGTELVKDFLSLTALSKKGMGEEELIAISGTKPLYWSQFHHLFATHLVTKNGLVGFSHDHVRRAVDERYIKNQTEWEKTCRRGIIAYFEKQEESGRGYEELAYQYNNLEEYAPLYRLLLSIPVFRYMYNHDKYELAAYWRTLRSNGYAFEAIREAVANAEEKDKEIIFYIMLFCRDELALSSFALLLSEDCESFLKSKKEKNSLQRATLYNSIGLIHHDMGNYSKALTYHFKAMRIQEKVLGKEHIDNSKIYSDIGKAYHETDNYPKALKFCFKALKICEKVQGDEHFETATLYNNIGVVHQSMRDYSKALELFLKALKIRERKLGEKHPDTAITYNNIGTVYGDMGNYPKALEYLLKATEIAVNILGLEHPQIATLYYNIGCAYDCMEEDLKALEYHHKAITIREKMLDKEHLDTASSYNKVGVIYYEMNNYSMALEYYLKAMRIREKVQGKEHLHTAKLYDNIGRAYDEMGDYTKALEYYLKAMEIYEKVPRKENLDDAISYNNVGVIFNNMGNYPKALEYFIKAKEILENVLGKENSNTIQSYNNIGFVFKEMGDLDHALEYYQKALEIQKAILPPDHEDIKESLGYIHEVRELIKKKDKS